LDERAELVKEVQRLIISKDPPLLPIYSGYNYNGRWDYVKGTQPGMRSLALFTTDLVWLEN
jgi:hypothetical protein